MENAEKYIVTVDCGDDGHVHENFDNGNSTTFNFANCKMQEGGIQFTVTAKAYGYADSVATTFVYNNMLGKVTGYYLDEETDTLLWGRRGKRRELRRERKRRHSRRHRKQNEFQFKELFGEHRRERLCKDERL